MPVKASRKKVGERVVGQGKVSVAVPQGREEATEFVRKVGDAQRRLETIAAAAESRIAVISQEAAQKAKPIQAEIDELVSGLYLFFEGHRVELTDGGKYKSVDLSTGSIGEFRNPFKVEFKEKVETIIERLRKLGLPQFIRTKEEVDRETMLASEESRALAATVQGVRITQAVEFRVKPVETLKEIIADATRLKRKVA